MNKTADKKDFFYMVILILTFIAVVIGVTVAAYYFLHKQEEGSSRVYTGTLTIQYLSGEIIDCHLLYPTEEPDYETEENVYKNNFRVTNTGTLDSIATVTIDIDENEFSDEVLKYKLFSESGNELEQGTISGVGKKEIAKNVELDSEETATYTLMIWLNESGVEQNEEMKKSLLGTIEVDANQKIEEE